jgi:carbon monoxide dehydrogenase subunit G
MTYVIALVAVVVVVVVVAVVLAVGALQPAAYEVSRSVEIEAPPAAVFPHVNDLKKFNEWSPWIKMDRDAKVAYGGGSDSFTWSGNSSIGEGKMTIAEREEPNLVRMRLDFVRPFPGTGEATFTLEPSGAGTRVTWVMKGEKVFVTKVIGLFVSMDRMIGPSFDRGLADLKAQAEKQ